MSFWGATVIINLLSPIPSLIEILYGGYYLYNLTLKRFFILHFQFPFLIIIFIFIHILYLHYNSSNNILFLNINNKIPFFPYIFLKDLLYYIFYFINILYQNNFNIFIFSHSDNSIEFNILFTPLHIIPEWYFLYQYAILKAIPNKNAGFIILLTSIIILFYFGEIKNLLILLFIIKNYLYQFYSYILLIIFIIFIYIGTQSPHIIYTCIL